MKKIEVVWPIIVPAGKYCWDYHVAGSCDHFDNEGGHATCELKFLGQKEVIGGVRKDPSCAALVEIVKEDKKQNNHSYDELKNFAQHIADAQDFEATMNAYFEDVLFRLQAMSEEELEEGKKFYAYED